MSTKLRDIFHIILNPDGTITRQSESEFYPIVPPSTTDPNSPSVSKDVPLNSEKNTWVRIYLPRESLNSDEIPAKKLPVLIYVHGGAFVVGSPGYPPFHEFCSVAAQRLGAVVVSVKYRLAPEDRLPAAYDDVLEALTWVKDGEDDWVKKYGDLSNCVLMGESAGGNITYHVGLTVANQVNNFKPLVIKGLVLIQPYFGGLDRSASEIRLVNDPILSLEVNDIFWELSLPVGASRDHEYCNPSMDGGSSLVDKVREMGWWVAVVGCDGDPLIDRNVELAKLLEGKGIIVTTLVSDGGYHGMFVCGGDPIKRVEFLDFVKDIWL
ncbi:carboxylesterase 1-like [Silene latifolia]|uniref:carboxylesterase 1-like n=1 Tax=Silene latifolia TaxID=37657 RepID=UPI003D776E3E